MLLVSRFPEALERALRAIPDVRVDVVAPESYSGTGAELVVLDEAGLADRVSRLRERAQGNTVALDALVEAVGGRVDIGAGEGTRS